jgi:hypothetical protein
VHLEPAKHKQKAWDVLIQEYKEVLAYDSQGGTTTTTLALVPTG